MENKIEAYEKEIEKLEEIKQFALINGLEETATNIQQAINALKRIIKTWEA